MVKCAIRGCKSRYDSQHKIRHFNLPKDEPRRSEWIKFTQQDPATFVQGRSYRFCELHFDQNQFELKRQDNWKKLKQTSIPSINLPTESERLLRKKKSKKEKRCTESGTTKLPTSETNSTPVLPTRVTRASTSKALNVHSDLPKQNDDDIVEVEVVCLTNEDGNRLNEIAAAGEPVPGIQELQNENEKLRRENEQLRITVLKMKKILARRRFTYLNVKALITDRKKAMAFNKRS